MNRTYQNTKFKFFCECFLVKGYQRSIIYDCNRNDFDFVPNEMINFIENSINKTVSEIYHLYSNEYHNIIKEYIDFLEDKEYIFWVEDSELEFFPCIGKKWEYPCIINNCILEIDPDSILDFADILYQLKEVNCHHVMIKLTKIINFKLLKFIIFKFKYSNIKTIQLILINNHYKQEEIIEILKFENRILEVYILETDTNNDISHNNQRIIFSTSSLYYFENNNYKISKENFRVNILLYLESLHYNTYYNRKVCISKTGEIKNCHTLKESFGNIKEGRIKDIVETSAFQFLWFANKDMIDICRDCEFRYMCVDSCQINYIESKKLFFRKEPCNYNPYQNIFNE